MTLHCIQVLDRPPGAINAEPATPSCLNHSENPNLRPLQKAATNPMLDNGLNEFDYCERFPASRLGK